MGASKPSSRLHTRSTVICVDSDRGVGQAAAWLGGRLLTGLLEVTDRPEALDTPAAGTWAGCGTFEGEWVLARFEHAVELHARDLTVATVGRWRGPDAGDWRSSLDERGYQLAVELVRAAVERGEVYQVNVCRVLSAPLPLQQAPEQAPGRALQRRPEQAPGRDMSGPLGSSVAALAGVLAAGNPAPYQGFLHLPGVLEVASASPELFLSRSGSTISSAPIKGTALTREGLADKDTAENIMIVDLVRNDLGRVAVPGSIAADHLLELQEHPGLVHLVSTVSGQLLPGIGWAGLLAATMPPGSVSGAPKSSALRAISELEPSPRGPYCGAFGWVDATTGDGTMAVAIRTFWIDRHRDRHGEPAPALQNEHNLRPQLRFGTGAGITWGSDPLAEWRESELKADRLVRLASVSGSDGGRVSP